MNWYEFLFSQDSIKKNRRHLYFWLCWWIYFSVCFYLYSNLLPWTGSRPAQVIVGDFILLKTSLLIFLYGFLYYACKAIFPGRLFAGRWYLKSGLVLLLLLLSFFSAHQLYWKVFPWIDSIFGEKKTVSFQSWFWPAVNLGIMNPAKVIITGIAITYVKNWWLKREETRKLENIKVRSELNLLKAQLRPTFLHESLRRIQELTEADSKETPSLLLKLSELLSYMLYECDKPRVQLERELDMLQHYFALERFGTIFKSEMELHILTIVDGKVIAPSILLKLFEVIKTHRENAGKHFWINMDVSLERDQLLVIAATGSLDLNDNIEESIEPDLTQLKKQLDLQYPLKYDLKKSNKQQIVIVRLNLTLSNDDTYENSARIVAEDEFPENMKHLP